MSGSIRIDRDVSIEMRDGIILRADIYRPDDPGKCPAIYHQPDYSSYIDLPVIPVNR